MIVIQSNSTDRSTNDIIDWLSFYNKEFLRINDDFEIKDIEIDFDSDDITINNISLKKCTYLYRRGDLRMYNSIHPIDKVDKVNNLILFNSIKEENETIITYIYKYFKNNINISSIQDINIDKLEQLEIAKRIGLSVPKTLISNNFQTISKFVNEFHCLTKAVSNINFQLLYPPHWNISFSLRTTLIDKNNLMKLTKGLPALFQQYIEKKIELRIFYLDGDFFTMAIFSQQNEKTRIDFRNYDANRPSRNVPYKLPKLIEEKLTEFMKSIKMNCGSIDMIYTPTGQYVFLEVNCIGQYQWLEQNCNYPISKSIATKLLGNERN